MAIAVPKDRPQETAGLEADNRNQADGKIRKTQLAGRAGGSRLLGRNGKPVRQQDHPEKERMCKREGRFRTWVLFLHSKEK